ncbi:MAG: GxxExxY protein [Gemmatimonadota bacterium]
MYEGLLARDLARRGRGVEGQKRVSFDFDGLRFEGAFRVDPFVERRVVVEVKSVAGFADVHTKQLLSYLRLLESRVGLLLDFGAPCSSRASAAPSSTPDPPILRSSGRCPAGPLPTLRGLAPREPPDPTPVLCASAPLCASVRRRRRDGATNRHPVREATRLRAAPPPQPSATCASSSVRCAAPQ